ncbi:MAG: hypothetical protein L6435_11125, partial [Anaerolineae bacterium]|nr:hypothetical protein [Anaerolineae bacterium]
LNTFFDLYERHWKDVVDQVYMYSMCDMDPNMLEYIEGRAHALGFKTFHHNGQLAYNDAINTMLDACEEDYLVILEGDIFILQPDGLETCFRRIESGEVDCVGSSRGCGTAGITKAIVEKFDLGTTASPEHQLSVCPSVWPSMFFIKTDLLKQTDRNFGPKTWRAGTHIPELDWTTVEAECGDAFVNTTFQIRALGAKFGYIHQYHAGPNDIGDHAGRGLFLQKKEGHLPWVHFGSLSTGMHGLLRDDKNVPLGIQAHPPVGMTHLLPEKGSPSWAHVAEEYTRRMSCFVLLARHCKIKDPKYSYYNAIYAEAAERGIRDMDLPQDRLDLYLKVYAELLSDVWS